MTRFLKEEAAAASDRKRCGEHSGQLRADSRANGVPLESYVFIAAALGVSLLFVTAEPLLPAGGQIVIMSVLVALLGLPHGALDPLLAYRLGLWHDWRTLILFLLGYMALSALVVGFWMIAPVAALVGFLIISSAHFGGDWNARQPAVVRLVTGMALVSLPAFRDAVEVGRLYAVLSGPNAEIVAALQAAAGPFLLTGLVISAALAARSRRHEAVEIVVAAVLALITPPLIFFVLYFCLLHSARHLREGFAMERKALGRPAGRALLGGATLVPILVAIAVLSSDALFVLDARLLQVVFIGLAALTVPHMLVVGIGERFPRHAVAIR